MPSFRAVTRDEHAADQLMEFGCAVGSGLDSPSPRVDNRRSGRRGVASSSRRRALEPSDKVLGAEVQMPVAKAVQMAMTSREPAIAVFDWDSRARRAHGLDSTAAGGDLLFRRGDLLMVNPDVFAMDDGGGSTRGWMAGTCHGNSGIFPCEYIKMIDES